ncbi:putative leucine-rich repeat-containing protein DDB_G0290503 [Chironomus tepperi]|uniref:putative leucine-rich repeat-containing protein DDB_G0290503 n=1 Tax=Chironomus tepperi TaxID=113505 RepID=UPI00391F6A00
MCNYIRAPNSRVTCPLCRKPYDKRSIRKLYFNVEEPELNAQLSNDLKRQKVISENLVQSNEKLQKELLQKSMEIDQMKESVLQKSTELNTIKTEYGIKCQAYSIIDTVNNEYLQDNMKLKDENLKLRMELEMIRQEKSRPDQTTIAKKHTGESEKFVDLTCSNCESDDDIQIIENSKKSEIIEIIEDSNDVELFQSKTADTTPKKNPEDINQSSSSCDETMKSAKKLENDDYKRFEDFILSQI